MTAGRPDTLSPDARRAVPAMGRLLELEAARILARRHGQAALRRTLETLLAEIRASLRDGASPLCEPSIILQEAGARLETAACAGMRGVINATGVVIHTNLGRAPLAPEAVHEMVQAAGYVSIEMALDSGARGSRQDHLEPLIRELTAAESALVVNNCASAVLLALAAIGEGAPVIVSRGELVEIGGGFRVPEIIAQGGCRLVEVGATNRTHIRDYERALADNPDARIILRTHPSNFRMTGFTSRPDLAALARLARSRGVLLIEDLGGGALVDLSSYGLADEPTVQESLAAGVDLVLFSADKLLGGPQAGIAAGQTKLIELMERHPLARAMRLDKLSLAALKATLELYRPPSDPLRAIPALRMLTEPEAVVRARAERLLTLLQAGPEPRGVQLDLVATQSFAGGGAMPMHPLPGAALRLSSRTLSGSTLARRLRLGEPSVVGRIVRDDVLLELRTVNEQELGALAVSIQQATAFSD